MTSLMNKIEQLIKREKTTPERKKNDDSKKSSNEILSELFSVFNADPPKIEEVPVKKSKKSKKKHKKEKKKRSRSCSSSSSNTDDSEYTRKRKKRKKSKSKKRKDRSRSRSKSPHVKVEKDKKNSSYIKSEDFKVKIENAVKIEPKLEIESIRETPQRRISIKLEDIELPTPTSIDASLIPLPESPREKYDPNDLRHKLETKKGEANNDSSKGPKIQIKNLKFSAVFEETVKKAEEEARKKKEKYEEGEYTDSSSSSVKDEPCNSEFPKSADPGGILKKQAADEKLAEDEEKIVKKSKQDADHSKTSKRSKSKSRKSRSRSRSGSRKRRHRSSSKSRRRSRSRHRSSSKSRRRSSSRSRHYSGRHSPVRHRGRRSRERERDRDRTASGVKLADHEKKRLLEVARRNAINMLKNGAVPAGAAVLPPHTRSQVMAAIQSGGKSVDELTDFCKHLSKKEALGELSSVASSDEGMSENEDTLAFHHPFLVKEKAPIVMNIRGGAPLPIKTSTSLAVVNKDELRLQFPVSSGTQHREKATEWVPVSPKKDMQVAKIGDKMVKPVASASKAIMPGIPEPPIPKTGPLALPAPVPPPEPPPYLKSFTTGSQLTSVPPAPPALPAPGPQAYPPGISKPAEPVIDLAQIVSQKLLMIRKEQEENEGPNNRGFGWSKDKSLGQFTGSTGAQILTPRELASGTQAWVKKDQLVRAAPVEGGMGMHLLQKMGWQPGKGLGKEGTGALQPLLLEVKLDTRGLQAKEEVSSRNKVMKAARPGARRPAAAPAPLVAGGKHPVSLLGEYCSKQKLGPPEYNLCFECGPDHKKNFLFRVKVAGTEYQPAVASANKKQAKADAAQLALQKLGILT